MRRLAMCVAAAGLAAMATGETASFDVVSVKPSPPDAKVSQTTYDPGAIIAHGVNLKQLIEWAYGMTDVQLSGGPGWIDSKFFDVEARAGGNHTKAELLLGLQPVLAERFKLGLHQDMKEMSVFSLTAPGNHAALHEAKGGPANIQLRAAPQAARDTPPSTIQVVGQSVSMQFLANNLTQILGQLVVDRTGLPGSYDFAAEGSLDAEAIASGGKRSAVTNVLLEAMPQLGLKLDSKKESVEILVIDHAEQPSVN